MDCTFSSLSYRDTGYFSAIVEAYVSNDNRLSAFFRYPPSLEGVAAAIEQRKQQPVNRKLLVAALRQQYQGLDISGKVDVNLDLLLRDNTFTVCTAHQPAIFTGNLFFIYKIVHAIRLAEKLRDAFPDNHFVPVFFMGSEDADLDELGHIFLNAEKITWDTPQKGAIGRMNTRGLDKIIARVEGELLVHPFGSGLVTLLKDCYLNSPDIQTATLKLVHRLFTDYGLLVLIPDQQDLKRQLIPVFEEELLQQTSSAIVTRTATRMAADFKVQAQPREINLFYLHNDLRERIVRAGNEWKVVNTDLSFDKEGIVRELHQHPERFSPNVILRGILQETILPDVAFIGGGGELAYWMELRDLFEHHRVPYPVLVVRNSFLILRRRWKELAQKLRLSIPDIFTDERLLLNRLVKENSGKQLHLDNEAAQLLQVYNQILSVAGQVDVTLKGHVEALRARAVGPLEALTKKMLKAEKRKFSDMSRQLSVLKNELFPNNNLQERVENFMPYYALWGRAFIDMIYEHSFGLEQRFGILETP